MFLGVLLTGGRQTCRWRPVQIPYWTEETSLCTKEAQVYTRFL